MSVIPRSPSSMTGAALEHDGAPDDLEEIEDLSRERGRDQTSPRTVALDAETLQALGVEPDDGGSLLNLLFDKLGELLGNGQSIEVASFGKFKVKPYRPAQPARVGDHSFVEAPYLGPIEFAASSLLQRQVDFTTLDREIVARCDQLYAALRDDPRVPRGRTPQLIKGAFRALTSVLIHHNSVEIPAVGLLVARPRPTQLVVDVRTGEVRATHGLKSIILRPVPALITRIPNLVVLKEPPPRVPPPPLLVNVAPEDEADDL